MVTEGDDHISHRHLEIIEPLKKVESSPEIVTTTYIAKEPGVYKVTWSNEHSWFNKKTLLYRVAVLKRA